MVPGFQMILLEVDDPNLEEVLNNSNSKKQLNVLMELIKKMNSLIEMEDLEEPVRTGEE